MRRHELAIAAVCEIAAAGKRLRQDEITERLKIKPRLLEPELQALVRSGVLRAAKGREGGYEFVRSPTTYDDVLTSIDAAYSAPREPSTEETVHTRIRDAMRRITIEVNR